MEMRAQLWTLLVLAVGCFTLLGVWIVVDGLSSLRWAHLYRQKTAEGLGFVFVGAKLILGGGIGVLGGAGFAVLGYVENGRRRRAILFIAAIVSLFLAGSALVALWVFNHGTRCIGPCGPAIWPPN